MPHRSRELNDKALRFYKAILNRFSASERRIDDTFLRKLAVIAKECGISGKGIGNDSRRRRPRSPFGKEALIPIRGNMKRADTCCAT